MLGAGVLIVFSGCVPGARGAEPLSTRIHIAKDGTITLLTGKVELGQGARTELTQVVAEELGVGPERVRVIMGDTGLTPDDGGTYGSLTTPLTVPVVRRAAAAARKLLGEVEPGEPLPGTAPEDVEVVAPAEWKVCGTSLPLVNGRDIVTGKLRYSADHVAPGMLYGKIKRGPGHHSSLASVDSAEAAKMPGVTVVRDGDLLGVTAPDRRTAERAVAAIKAEWHTKPLVAAAELAEHFRKTAREPVFRPGSRYPALIEKGRLEEGRAGAFATYQATYFVRNIAHAPLEPRAALAEWHDDGSVSVICGGQVPFGVREQVAKAFALPAEKARIISAAVGSGYGGKHSGECQLEAARLAKAAGKPVLLEWSREEEFTCSYARPAGLLEARSAVRQDGQVTAWEFHNYNSGAAGLPPPYAFPNVYCGFHAADSPLRQGSYRALAATANTFARELHMEELAARLRMDPLEFRLKNIDNPRLRAALETAAGRFGWKERTRREGVGYGLAANLEKGGHLGAVVEVRMDGREARVTRAVVSMDCGAIINPDNLKNQIAGAFLMGIGGALFEELRYDERQVTNPSFSAYRVPRFSDAPELEVVLLDRRDQPSAGAGEAPITVAAPAIAAAIHDATGEWRRELPLLGRGG